MRVLIGVLSCARDRWAHQQARDTWLKDCPADYKFILGSDQKSPIAEDEIQLDADDKSWGCIEKIKAFIRYAVSDYDYLFKCDIDTYCHIPRLLNSQFEQHDFIGYGGSYGGSGYWLSREAMRLILSSEYETGCKAEDGHVLHTLAKLGVHPFQDSRYHSLTKDGPSPENSIITSHWYSEHDAVRDGKIYERRIDYSERLRLVPEYHRIASKINAE